MNMMDKLLSGIIYMDSVTQLHLSSSPLKFLSNRPRHRTLVGPAKLKVVDSHFFALYIGLNNAIKSVAHDIENDHLEMENPISG